MAKAFEDTGHTNQWIKNQIHSSQKNRRGWNVSLCAREEEQKDRQKAFKYSLIVKDSKIRQEIHITIRKMKAEGKTKLEVLIALTQNPEYKAYSQYFKSWIENDYRENPRKSPWTSKTKITPEKEER